MALGDSVSTKNWKWHDSNSSCSDDDENDDEYEDENDGDKDKDELGRSRTAFREASSSNSNRNRRLRSVRAAAAVPSLSLSSLSTFASNRNHNNTGKAKTNQGSRHQTQPNLQSRSQPRAGSGDSPPTSNLRRTQRRRRRPASKGSGFLSDTSSSDKSSSSSSSSSSDDSLFLRESRFPAFAGTARTGTATRRSQTVSNPAIQAGRSRQSLPSTSHTGQTPRNESIRPRSSESSEHRKTRGIYEGIPREESDASLDGRGDQIDNDGGNGNDVDIDSDGDIDSDSDSDDTAELIRQLNQTVSPRNPLVIEPPFRLPLHAYSHPPEPEHDGEHGNSNYGNQPLRGDDPFLDADDEQSVDGSDAIRERSSPNVNSNVNSNANSNVNSNANADSMARKAPPRAVPNGDHIVDNTEPNKNDSEHHSPVRFQLPPQFSSSEDEDEDDNEDEEEKEQQAEDHLFAEGGDVPRSAVPCDEIRTPRAGQTHSTKKSSEHSFRNNTSGDDWHALSGGVIPRNGQAKAVATTAATAATAAASVHERQNPREGEHPEVMEGHRENFPLPSQESSIAMQSDRELYEAAFSLPGQQQHFPPRKTDDEDERDHPTRSGSRAQGSSRSLDHEYPPSSSLDPNQNHESDEALFGAASSGKGDDDQNTHTRVRDALPLRPRPRPHQPCIDLVDSEEDSEGQRPKRLVPNYRQRSRTDNNSRQRLETEESPDGPRRRRSPRFNTASRDFIHSHKTHSRYQHQEIGPNENNVEEEDDDIYEFEDNSHNGVQTSTRSIPNPNRPRRVTQDHTNNIARHNSGIVTRSADSNSCSARRRYHHPEPKHNEDPGEGSRPPKFQLQPTNHHHRGIVPRPWSSTIAVHSHAYPTTTRRLRDPTASNRSLAASVPPDLQQQQQQQQQQRHQPPINSTNNRTGDIRTFLNRKSLVEETRNRAKTIESVRSHRYDIQGHSDVTMLRPPEVEPTRGSRSQTQTQTRRNTRPPDNEWKENEDDVIEVFDDEDEAGASTSTAAPAHRRRTASAAKAKPRAKRKRVTTKRKTKSRTTGGRKRTRSNSGGRSRGNGRGGRYAGRGGGGGSNDCGAWGPIAGGWSSARPVNREDPAFQNVGAEITF
eukprot:jgi/Psemu1/18151/gm1.18151_g